jgi:hypothetical protein
MHDEVTGISKSRRGAGVVRFFKIVAALIRASVAFVVIVVAVLMTALWLTLGATLLLFSAVAGIARDGGGRRLRSTGAHLIRSGPSRRLVKAAMHRARRPWNRQRSSHKV